MSKFIENLKLHSIGISRDNMPQIKKEDRKAFLKFLDKNDVVYYTQEKDFKDLRPTQQNYSRDPIPCCCEEPVIISNDDYIVDGHHRWQNHICFCDEEKINDYHSKCIVLSTGILECLSLAKRFLGEKSE